MDGRVAVIGGVVVLLGADGIEPLGPLVEIRDDAGRMQFRERRLESVVVLEV